MTDIYLGIALVLAVATLAGTLAYRAARRGGRWVGVPIAVLAVAALGLNVAYFRHSVWPSKILPYSNLMVLAEPSPILAAILVGVGVVILPGGVARRALWLVPLIGVCLFASYGFLLGTPPRLGNVWRAGVCRQTSPASCGPAAAATLLAAHGIPATEGEMARLCLTTADGTSSRAIYRGLVLKTAGTDYRVELLRGTLEDLRKLKGPVLLNVRLDPKSTTDPIYQQKWGWRPGVAHSIVLFRSIRDGRLMVGDPAVGREFWRQKDLETLWHGEGFRLVPR
jgi:predicted double-glycine peptidase